jgi:hypothetical protein
MLTRWSKLRQPSKQKAVLIDVKIALDSVGRNKLFPAMEEFDIPTHPGDQGLETKA